MRNHDLENTQLKTYLQEQLINQFAKNKPFLIIFDPHQVLQDFIQETVKGHLDSAQIQVMGVEAQNSPQEYLQRKEIMQDFDETTGWYQHRWIIYIFGQHADQIEHFRSFYYYQELGDTLKVGAIDTFLQSAQLQIIEKGKDVSLIDQYPELNQPIFNVLLDFPIGSLRTTKAEFSMLAFWTALLQTDKFPALLNEKTSVLIRTRLLHANEIELSHLILELIYKWNGEEYEQSDQQTQIDQFFTPLFHYLAKKLQFKQFLAFRQSEQNLKDHKKTIQCQNSLKQFIRYMLLLGNKNAIKTTVSPSPQTNITDFLSTADSHQQSIDSIIETVPRQTRQMMLRVLYQWVHSTEERMKKQFQLWMALIREEIGGFTKPIPKEEWQQYHKWFDYTGLLEIRLINTLLNQFSEKQLDKKLTPNLKQTIAHRKTLWANHAPEWWKDTPLFSKKNLNRGITIQELWHLTHIICEFYLFDENKSIKPKAASSLTWIKFRHSVWDLQKKYNELMNYKYRKSLSDLSGFERMSEKIREVDKIYAGIITRSNPIFQEYYLTQLKKSPPTNTKTLKAMQDNFAFNTSKGLMNGWSSHLKQKKKVAVIFCDGLRQDLALFIQDSLTKFKSEHKHFINNHSIERIHTLSPFPSNTELGWNALTLNHDSLQIHRSKKQAALSAIHISQSNSENVDQNSASGKNNPQDQQILSNFSHAQRNQRIEDILQKKITEKGNDQTSCQVRMINPDRYKQEIQRISNPKVIPIIWIDKIDNHDWSPTTFYHAIPPILTQIRNMIAEIHLSGYDYIYLLTDHGFYFVDKTMLIEDIPAGTCKPRYCITSQEYAENDKNAYPQWIILNAKNLASHSNYNIDHNCTLIFPKTQELFQKPKTKTTQKFAYVHGGISFLESDLVFLKSHCILHQTVQIEAIVVKNPPGNHYQTGEPAFELESEKNGQEYVEIQVQGQRTEEKLQPTKIHVELSDDRLEVKPKRPYRLARNSDKNYLIYFPKNTKNPAVPIVDTFIVNVLNDQKQIIYRKEITVTPKRVVDDLF